jgi:hypothetical protein
MMLCRLWLHDQQALVLVHKPQYLDLCNTDLDPHPNNCIFMNTDANPYLLVEISYSMQHQVYNLLH